MYCTSYAELYDVPCTILRFGIPYGPRARPAAVIPIFVSKALKGEPLTIAGDGQQTRRFVYVEDLAEGVVAALERGAKDRIYNLAGDETVTIRELADVVSDLVGDTEIVHTPGRNGDFGGAVISNERAAEELGWRASTPLREGVRRYLAWLEPERARTEPVASGPHRPGVPAAGARTPGLADAPRLLAERLDRRPGVRRRNADPLDARLPQRRLRDRAGRLRRGHLPDRDSRRAQPAAPRPRRSSPHGGAALAGWLLVAYVLLETVPWTRHFFNLGMPHKGTVALSRDGPGDRAGGGDRCDALARREEAATTPSASGHQAVPLSGEAPSGRPAAETAAMAATRPSSIASRIAGSAATVPRQQSGCAVVVGVVEQQHVAGAQVLGRLGRDRRRVTGPRASRDPSVTRAAARARGRCTSTIPG